MSVSLGCMVGAELLCATERGSGRAPARPPAEGTVARVARAASERPREGGEPLSGEGQLPASARAVPQAVSCDMIFGKLDEQYAFQPPGISQPLILMPSLRMPPLKISRPVLTCCETRTGVVSSVCSSIVFWPVTPKVVVGVPGVTATPSEFDASVTSERFASGSTFVPSGSFVIVIAWSICAWCTESWTMNCMPMGMPRSRKHGLSIGRYICPLQPYPCQRRPPQVTGARSKSRVGWNTPTLRLPGVPGLLTEPTRRKLTGRKIELEPFER